MTFLRPIGLSEAEVIVFNKTHEGNYTQRVRGKVHETWTVFYRVEDRGTSYLGQPYLVLLTELGFFHIVGRRHLPFDETLPGARIRFRWSQGHTWRMVDKSTLRLLSPSPGGSLPPHTTWTEYRYMLLLERRRTDVAKGAVTGRDNGGPV